MVPRMAVRLSALLVVTAFLWGCPPPPTMEDPSPGSPDCGLLDPNVVLSSKLCPDQRRLLQNEGKPESIRPSPAGGMSWAYEFHSGDVFGQRGGYRFYDFTRDGKLAKKREEFLYRQEK